MFLPFSPLSISTDGTRHSCTNVACNQYSGSVRHGLSWDPISHGGVGPLVDPRLHIVESGMVGSGALSLLCGKCTTVIVGGSIPYCKGHWGSMSRGVATTSNEQKANILCESGFVDRTMWEGVTQAPTGTPRWERIRASISGDFSESELLIEQCSKSKLPSPNCPLDLEDLDAGSNHSSPNRSLCPKLASESCFLSK